MTTGLSTLQRKHRDCSVYSSHRVFWSQNGVIASQSSPFESWGGFVRKSDHHFHRWKMAMTGGPLPRWSPMILGKARIFGASPVPHVIAPQAQQVVPRQGQGTAIGGLEAEVLEASLASSGWLKPFESISYITRYHKIPIYHNLSIDIILKKNGYLRRSGWFLKIEIRFSAWDFHEPFGPFVAPGHQNVGKRSPWTSRCWSSAHVPPGPLILLRWTEHDFFV